MGCIFCTYIPGMTTFEENKYIKQIQSKYNILVQLLGVFFYAFDFCGFCVVIRFFHARHNGQWPPTSKDFLSQILSITFIFLS